MKMKISFFKYIILRASKTTNMNYLSALFFTQGVSDFSQMLQKYLRDVKY